MQITIHVENPQAVNLEELIKQTKKNLMHMSALELQAILKRNTPADTGHLRSAWTLQETEDKVSFTNSAKYALWVDEGTGLYGPRHQRITPKKSSVLLWKPSIKYKGKYGPVTPRGKYKGYYAFRSVKGQKGQLYVDKSVKKFIDRLPIIVRNAAQKASNQL